MAWQRGIGVVVRARVARGAILRPGLVLLAVVIEGRDRFDDLRFDDVKR